MAAKTLQHTRRGLKMVGSKSLFDLDEPQWIADDSVCSLGACYPLICFNYLNPFANSQVSACQKCQQTFTMFNRRVRTVIHE